MSVDFMSSETKINLMKAFAGESQARNRYTFAAAAARKAGLYAVEGVFLYTAGQEKEHAEIFFNHLNKADGENICIEAGFPVETYGDILKSLKNAKHNEYEEYEEVYPSFAKTAEREGFYAIASSFNQIAEIEKTHGDRFQKYADAIMENRLFESETEIEWVCLNCGHTYRGTKALEKCPVCMHEKGYFMKAEYSPYRN